MLRFTQGTKKNPQRTALQRRRIYHLPGCTPNVRSSDSRIVLPAAPSRPIGLSGQWLRAAFVPDHSGGSVPEFHRFPFYGRQANIQMPNLLLERLYENPRFLSSIDNLMEAFRGFAGSDIQSQAPVCTSRIER